MTAQAATPIAVPIDRLDPDTKDLALLGQRARRAKERRQQQKSDDAQAAVTGIAAADAPPHTKGVGR